MKHLTKPFLAISFAVLTACAALGPVSIPTSGPVMRQVQRVVERHDSYVNADTRLAPEVKTADLAESQAVLELMVAMPDGVPPTMLEPRLTPVMDRHDHYVSFDTSLDPLNHDSYLATTEGLRELLKAAMPGQH